MAELEFKDLYKDRTILTQEFLEVEFGFRVDSEYPEIIFKNYYVNICDAIFQLNVFRPTSEEIEEILTNNQAKRFSQFKGQISVEKERKYLFLLAQAKQLKYDIDNGRANMIRGESFNLCEDSKQLLTRIGLVQPIWY